jgi:hypothetical protein
VIRVLDEIDLRHSKFSNQGDRGFIASIDPSFDFFDSQVISEISNDALKSLGCKTLILMASGHDIP